MGFFVQTADEPRLYLAVIRLRPGVPGPFVWTRDPSAAELYPTAGRAEAAGRDAARGFHTETRFEVARAAG